MIVYEPPIAADSVPIIELGASGGFLAASEQRAARAIRAAARDMGFFYVIDHGVPDALTAAELAAARAFFTQPIEARMALDFRQSKVRRGYEPIGLQTLDEGSPPDLKESLMLGRELGPDHPWVKAGTPYEGANQWPTTLPGFREQAMAYLDAIIDLGRRLARLIALSLELPGDYFAPALLEPSCTTRMLRYPAQTGIADNQIGCGAHTDWGFLTILLQDDAGGLEVQNSAGEWILAAPIPGAFVVNLGDMLPRLTNGLYRSTLHRVLNNVSGRDRYSVASFFSPGFDHAFTCAPTCLPAGAEPPAAVTVGEHIQHMFDLTYGHLA